MRKFIVILFIVLLMPAYVYAGCGCGAKSSPAPVVSTSNPDILSASKISLMMNRMNLTNKSIVLNKSSNEYEVQGQKPVRLFGLFNMNMEIKTYVDAETGEIIETKMPWWSFLTS